MSAPWGQRLLRGAPGSVVKLTLLRAATDPIDVSLVRERLAPPARARAACSRAGRATWGVRVSPRTARRGPRRDRDLTKGGAQNLVLDLRGAAAARPRRGEGGRALPEGRRRGEAGRAQGARAGVNADPARQAWDRPLAVLVDNGTAGAAEIVAAAVLDAGRAPIVGERTFGRAPVQKTIPLAEGGLVITVARYFSPKGTAIHGKGIEPTVIVESPMRTTSRRVGHLAAPDKSTDPILEKALEVLRTRR